MAICCELARFSVVFKEGHYFTDTNGTCYLTYFDCKSIQPFIINLKENKTVGTLCLFAEMPLHKISFPTFCINSTGTKGAYVVSDGRQYNLHLRSLRPSAPATLFIKNIRPSAMALTEDGKYIAVSCQTKLYPDNSLKSGGIQIFDTSTKVLVLQYAPQRDCGRIGDVAYSVLLTNSHIVYICETKIRAVKWYHDIRCDNSELTVDPVEVCSNLLPMPTQRLVFAPDVPAYRFLNGMQHQPEQQGNKVTAMRVVSPHVYEVVYFDRTVWRGLFDGHSTLNGWSHANHHIFCEINPDFGKLVLMMFTLGGLFLENSVMLATASNLLIPLYFLRRK